MRRISLCLGPRHHHNKNAERTRAPKDCLISLSMAFLTAFNNSRILPINAPDSLQMRGFLVLIVWGLIAPLIEPIWRQLWAFETKGHAISAIMYATGLVYLKGDNPIYLPWTRKGGGGGPYLTEWDACIYDHSWLAPNLEFLKSTLTPDYVLERLLKPLRVCSMQTPISDLAYKIAKDAQSRKDIIELRVGRFT